MIPDKKTFKDRDEYCQYLFDILILTQQEIDSYAFLVNRITGRYFHQGMFISETSETNMNEYVNAKIEILKEKQDAAYRALMEVSGDG